MRRGRWQNPGKRDAFDAKYGLYNAKITMVGVWDTVGALGIPAIVGGVDPAQFGFLDTSLHPDVLNAHQALAIDERRQKFPPTLWIPPAAPVAGQILQQVWFSGEGHEVFPDDAACAEHLDKVRWSGSCERRALLPAETCRCMVRADSGFSDGSFLDFLEGRTLPYVVAERCWA